MPPAKKTIAKKAPAKKVPAKKAPAKKAPATKAPATKAPAKKSPAKNAAKDEKAMLFAPAAGSDLDIQTRIKAVIAILQDAPVSAPKAAAAAMILEGVLKVM